MSELNAKSVHGGKREGAGRKPKFKEPTAVVRLPVSLVHEIKKKLADEKKEPEIDNIRQIEAISKISIPLATERVQAGFPSPAQDYVDKNLDLNEFLVGNENATFMVRVNSLSMLNAGLDIDDMLIVDRSLTAQHRDIVVACVDNEFTVKRLIIEEAKVWLKAENEGFPDIHFTEGQEMQIWGVVTSVIKKFK